jgi:hypothetical protein
LVAQGSATIFVKSFLPRRLLAGTVGGLVAKALEALHAEEI